MKIFVISCYSRCGSYFAPYLKSITVIAETQDNAITEAYKWMNATGNTFERKQENWNISVVELTGNAQVIDWEISSDY